MSTQIIACLEPPNLDGYDRNLKSSQQPDSIPKTFLDAMKVREEVFVKEQGVPLENEFDSDDTRACHWIVYASVDTVTATEANYHNGNFATQTSKVTKSLAIGTIRLVPFPHPPHPEPSSKYAADALKSGPNPKSSNPPPDMIDRATFYHDGQEPYIKLGRLAVLKEFRGSGIANILVSAAIAWAWKNPTYFNPSLLAVEMGRMSTSKPGGISTWKGLLCVHAQEQVAKAWAKWGFNIDEGMGRWDEEGINHVGMFQRLSIEG